VNLSTNTGGWFSGGAIESQKVFDGYFLQLRRGSPSFQIWAISGGIAPRSIMRKFCASDP